MSLLNNISKANCRVMAFPILAVIAGGNGTFYYLHEKKKSPTRA